MTELASGARQFVENSLTLEQLRRKTVVLQLVRNDVVVFVIAKPKRRRADGKLGRLAAETSAVGDDADVALMVVE